MKKQFYRMLFIALLALMQTTWVQAQVNSEVRKVPPGAPKSYFDMRFVDTNFDYQSSTPSQSSMSFAPLKGGYGDEDTPQRVKLTVAFEFDDTKYRLYDVMPYNLENKNNRPQEYNPDSRVFYVPEGTYDIYATFSSLTLSYGDWPIDDNFYIIIKENVDVHEETSITIRPEEATNKIEIQTYLANGELAKLSLYDPTQLDETETWPLVEPGNVSSIGTNLIIKNPNKGSLPILFGDSYAINAEHVSSFPVYVNDVSDEYTFALYKFILDNERNIFTSYYEKQGGDRATLSNAPNDYKMYEMKIAQSEYGKQYIDDFQDYVSYQFFDENRGMGLTQQYTTGKKDDFIRIFIGNTPEQLNLYSKTYIGRKDSQQTVLFEEEWGSHEEEVITTVTSQPIVQRNGKIRIINNGKTTVQNSQGYQPYLVDSDIYYYDALEENPILSYLLDRIKGVQGDNVPILTHCKSSIWASYYNVYMTYLEPCYLGRYGESCESDLNAALTNIKINGEDYMNKDEAVSCWSEDEEQLTGTVDITMTNKNRKIDGLQGQNLATIHYDRDQEDSSAPVLQMLHFKDREGYITDRFETAEGSLMELFAGDYNEHLYGEYDLYFDRAKAKNVNVAYAPYGKDNWTDLTLEENPEYYSNLMGWYYAASLENVTGAAEQGWFDLKIRLEDESGNWQEQIVSPAFQIKSLVDTGIENMEHPTWNMEHAEAVYDVVGRRLGSNLSTRQLVNSSTCNKGIRIVRKANGDVRKVVAK